VAGDNPLVRRRVFPGLARLGFVSQEGVAGSDRGSGGGQVLLSLGVVVSRLVQVGVLGTSYWVADFHLPALCSHAAPAYAQYVVAIGVAPRLWPSNTTYPRSTPTTGR